MNTINNQVIFEMTEESDENSIFSIAMGAVNGTQITDETFNKYR